MAKSDLKRSNGGKSTRFHFNLHLDLTIKPVLTAADRKEFIRVPERIYGPGDNWIKPLFMERRDHLDPAKNPYFQHAEVSLWLALKDGRPAGRISAQICRLYLARHNAQTGHFGFLDAIDDKSVFAGLMATAEGWLRHKGMTGIQGPFSFSINEEAGLLVEGFDDPPSMMMGHAKPYYAKHLEALGYSKVKDLLAYDYHTDSELPRSARAMVERARSSGEITVRPLRKNRFDEDLDAILDIFNDAWSDNWGFVPMTDQEIAHLGQNLKMLVKERFIAIAEHNNEPAAMAVTLPNINDVIQDLDGAVLPLGWVKLLWRLKFRPPRSVRLPLMGVRKAYQGTPLGAALALSVIDAVRVYHKSNGTHRGELSWILEDNTPMRRMIEMIGGKQYKTYRIYQRGLRGDAP